MPENQAEISLYEQQFLIKRRFFYIIYRYTAWGLALSAITAWCLLYWLKPVLVSSSHILALIKSILESHDILYYVQGEGFLQLRPLAQPAAVMVDEKQFSEAKEIMKDFKLRFTGLAPRENDDSPEM